MLIRTLLLCLFLSASNLVFSQSETTQLLTKDIFIYGFDNQTDSYGSDFLMISNQVPIKPGTQFGILGHGVSFDQGQNSYLFPNNLKSYISLTYNGADSIPAASELKLHLLVNSLDEITSAKVFNDQTDITNSFTIDIVGVNKSLSHSDSTSILLYQGSWFQIDNHHHLLGHAIDGLSLGVVNNSSYIPPSLQGAMVNLPGTPGPGGSGVSSLVALFDCDGLLYLCDITDLFTDEELWEILNGTGVNDFDLGVLEEIICDLVPDPCTLSVDLILGDFNCDLLYFPLFIDVRGNHPPFTHQWSNGQTGRSGGLGNSNGIQVLQTGTYFVTVTDNSGCQVSQGIYITVPAALSVDLGPDWELCPGDDHDITPVVSGGDSPFIYSWSDGTTEETNSLTNVQNDIYLNVTVTDENGCSSTDDIYIDVLVFPTPLITYDNCLNQIELFLSYFDYCENYLEIYNEATSSWDNLGQVPFPFTLIESGLYRVRASCDCGFVVSNELQIDFLEISGFGCKIYVNSYPCTSGDWTLTNTSTGQIHSSGINAPLLLEFEIVEDGNYELILLCGSGCYQFISNSVSFDGCDGLCSEINETTPNDGDWLTNNIFISEADQEITFDFNADYVPDRLEVLVNGNEVINSGEISSGYHENEVDTHWANNCAIGLDTNLDLCCGGLVHFSQSVCVLKDDIITVIVDSQACGTGQNANDCPTNPNPPCPINDGIWELTVNCASCSQGRIANTQDENSISIEPITGVNTIKALKGKNSLFTIYPNPADQKIHIEHQIKSKLPIQVSLFAISGERVISEHFKGDDKTLALDSDELPEGSYIIRIVSGEYMHTEKIFISHK